jgi:SAM-dependent methyltransferase
MLAEPLPRQPVAVLDVGAGDGYVGGELLESLPNGSSVTCVDSEYTDQHIESLRGSAPSGLSFSRAAPEREFDVIVLLDVLEHIEDHEGFLSDFVANRLRPGGLLLISVPAHQMLYTQHDVALGHHRRYSARELREVVEQAGLQQRQAGSLFGSLLLPRAVSKLLERARGIESRPSATGPADQISTGVSVWQHGRVVTNAIRGALEIDAKICELAARVQAPSAGLSVWALCERTR